LTDFSDKIMRKNKEHFPQKGVSAASIRGGRRRRKCGQIGGRSRHGLTDLCKEL
jgi:hypothetical protein